MKSLINFFKFIFDKNTYKKDEPDTLTFVYCKPKYTYHLWLREFDNNAMQVIDESFSQTYSYKNKMFDDLDEFFSNFNFKFKIKVDNKRLSLLKDIKEQMQEAIEKGNDFNGEIGKGLNNFTIGVHMTLYKHEAK